MKMLAAILGVALLYSPVLSAVDPTPLTKRNSDTNHISTIDYVNGRFMAGAFKKTAQSMDGMSWEYTDYPLNPNSFWIEYAYAIDYANGTYVESGGYDGGWIWTSTNGTTGTFSFTPGVIFSIAHGPEGFVGVGARWYHMPALIGYSTDGYSWTYPDSGWTNEYLNGVAYGAGKYVAVGDSGAVLSSTNGTDWKVYSPAYYPNFKNLNFQDVIFAGGQFVAVGTSGTILLSATGNGWSRTSSGNNNLNAVAYGNDTYVAVGDNGTMLISTNAMSWTGVNSGTSVNLTDIAYGNGRFVILGDNGSLYPTNTVLYSRSFWPDLKISKETGGVKLTMSGGEADGVYHLQSAEDVGFSSSINLATHYTINGATISRDTNYLKNPKMFYRLTDR